MKSVVPGMIFRQRHILRFPYARECWLYKVANKEGELVGIGTSLASAREWAKARKLPIVLTWKV